MSAKKPILLILLCFLVPGLVFAQSKMIPVVIDGDEINYLQEEGKVTAKGNVKIVYKDTELYCDRIEYDANTNTADIIGDVKIVRGESVLTGRDVFYNFETQNAELKDAKLSDTPIYGSAVSAEKIGKEKYLLNKGYVTTCDRDKPHYRLTARRVTVYPGEKVVAKNMIFKVGDFPLFYVPYFSQSLKDKSFPFELSPGKNGDWGYYMLTRWRYNLNEENRGKIMLDWYEERGVGAGIIHNMDSKKYGKSLLRYYVIQDELYKLENRNELFDTYPARKRIPSKRLDDDRYDVSFSYAVDPSPNLSIRSEINKFSDEFLRKDFFRQEYEIEPHPLSYTLATYAFPTSSLSFLAQKRLNRFFTETEYLPQVEYDFYRQRIGDSKFYFQSNEVLGSLAYRLANSGTEYEATRLYAHNTFSYVDRIKWLVINPYIGSYTAFYSRNKYEEDEVFRFAPDMGIAFSTKMYKPFRANFSMFGRQVEEMRHILTPRLEYAYVHDPTVSNDNIYQFDSLDNLAREEKIIFTLDNKIQARNAEETWDFIYFSPSLEYKLNREGKGSYLDKLKAELEIYPKKGLSLNADSEYDFVTETFKEVNADLTVKGYKDAAGPGKNSKKAQEEEYSFSLGHRYLRKDSSQGTMRLKCQLTPKLQFRNYLRYEYDSGDLERQQYVLRTDLHCWWLDIGLDVDRPDAGGKHFTIWFVFTLKAFPDINVGFDQTYSGAKASY